MYRSLKGRTPESAVKSFSNLTCINLHCLLESSFGQQFLTYPVEKPTVCDLGKRHKRENRKQYACLRQNKFILKFRTWFKFSTKIVIFNVKI